jgi:outer membrane protein OmpA-like peptidoglycan-associated protein
MVGRHCAALLSSLVLVLALGACRHEGSSSFAAGAQAHIVAVDWSSMPPASPRTTPPISLVSPDGTALDLSELHVRAVVEGPLALTELHLTFHNRSPRQIEGEFELLLPESAAVSRLAMRIGDRWKEGEVVEKRRATATYEDFIRPAPRDPMLLDRERGNRFTARVFPIPANGEVRIILSYSHALVDEPYRLALAGLGSIERFEVNVAESGLNRRGRPWRRWHRDERGPFVPDRDLVLARDPEVPDGLRAGSLAIARVTIPGSIESDAITSSERVDVMLDTSASLGVELEAALARLQGLVAELVESADPQLRVAAFDQGVEIVYEGPASGFSNTQLERLRARGSEGATDLAGALRQLAANGPGARVIVMSDGVATLGRRDVPALREAIDALAQAGTRRLDVIAIGRAPANATLASLTHAGLVIDGKLEPESIATRIQQQPAAPAKVEVPGASWSWPEQLAAARPGDELLVFAELDGASPLRIRFGDLGERELETVAGTPALIRRAHAGARIDALMRELGELGEASEQPRVAEIVALSTEYRVLSPFTSMIVLETEHDYRRYGIEREALSDILMVTDDGIVTWNPGDEGRGHVSASESGLPSAALNLEPTAPELGDEPDEDEDLCPNEDETLNGFKDDDGCPDVIPHEFRAYAGVIRGIHFAAGSARIEPDPNLVLDRAVEVLLRYPEVMIEISGHSDSKGSRARAFELSKNRAEAVRDYLVAHGVAERRLQVRAAGPDEPIAPNDTEAGRAENRRIEFELLRMRDKGAGLHPPYHGGYAELQAQLARGDASQAIATAQLLRREQPGPLSTIGLGQAVAVDGQLAAAARVFGSLIDARPEDAEQLRVAAGWLSWIATLDERGDVGTQAQALALDALQRAVAARPDHAIGHHQLGLALLRAGDHEAAFDAIAAGLASSEWRAIETLRADLGLIAAAWIAVEPARKAEIMARLAVLETRVADEPTVLVVLTWNNDDTDVDLIVDGSLVSRGTDVADGYGPETRNFRGVDQPITLAVHYARRGAMGDLFGLVEIVHHDGAGGLKFEQRPLVIQADGGTLAMGSVQTGAS